MTEHIDIEVLADYAEALLDSAASARVSRHLEECASCAEQFASLGEVSAYLSALPPPAMPSDIAARIETAIAAESRERSSQSAPADAPAGTVVPFRSRSRRWLVPLTAAAAAVVVVGGGFAIVKHLSGGPVSDSSEPGTAAATKTAPVLPKAAPPSMMKSGTHYTTAALGAQVNSVMRKSKSGTGVLRPKAGRDTPPPSMPADVAGCVDRITSKAGSGPLLVDSGTYDGQAVKVLVFRKSSTPSRYDVWIVGAACSESADGVVSHTTVPRHS